MIGRDLNLGLLKLLFSGYFISMPFIWAYTLFSGRVTPTILVSMMMCSIIFVKVIVTKSTLVDKELYRIVTIYIFYCCAVLVAAVLSGNYTQSAFNHTTSYLISPLVFYIAPILYGRILFSKSSGVILRKDLSRRIPALLMMI